ncbi:MAG: hypothetical protein MUE64_05555 [Ignavibacteriaceae bacterium]|jgi:hypothetical protein|nr:hypothetical protein [Ignavibacteriaceae bacterium]MCU0406432.1 hypothetical protein [Ignavibacteriaceae bacterium]
MKTLILTLVTLSLAFLTGCQENSITDPVVKDIVIKDQASEPDKYFQGTISLDGLLADPHPVMNTFYRITGQVEYSFSVYIADPIPPVPQRYISVHCNTNADLVYVCTVCSPSVEDQLAGFIAEAWEEYRPLGENNTTTIDKTFSIQGREDGMVLKTRFLVTEDKIELNAMWLALPGANPIATDINHY